MEDLIGKLAGWMTAHPDLVLAGVCYVVIGAANAVMKHAEPGSSWAKFLHAIVDIVSPLARHDSPGTLKLPGTRSKPPASPSDG